jgi:hypothetical protein
MTTYCAPGPNQHQINLQATLSASSAFAEPPVQPHHPITCTGPLRLNEDGSLECDHARTEPKDQRTAYCIDHSIALLLIETAVRELGPPQG